MRPAWHALAIGRILESMPVRDLTSVEPRAPGTGTPDVRPFRFLADPGDATDGPSLRETARRAESIGYHVLVYPDHVVIPFGFVPLLSVVAAVTERIRVAPFVTNNDFRHPALLAQDLATLDVLSGGRVEVALGAGWNRPEYEALGLPFDPPGVRISRLAEAVTVIKGCFADGPFSFAGAHYTITGHDGRPRPIQQPHPPIFIGGGGKRILTLAAREADIVGLAPRTLPAGDGGDVVRSDPRSITIAATEEKIGWIREAAGDRFASLELNVYPTGSPPLITDHARKEAADIIDKVRARTGVEVTVDELLESPQVFIGSVDGLVAKFAELRERLGISSFTVGDVDTLAPVVERLSGF
jgi:probable F420-dependent oxidoreductase